jgi:hypothetical protein
MGRSGRDGGAVPEAASARRPARALRLRNIDAAPRRGGSAPPPAPKQSSGLLLRRRRLDRFRRCDAPAGGQPPGKPETVLMMLGVGCVFSRDCGRRADALLAQPPLIGPSGRGCPRRGRVVPLQVEVRVAIGAVWFLEQDVLLCALPERAAAPSPEHRTPARRRPRAPAAGRLAIIRLRWPPSTTNASNFRPRASSSRHQLALDEEAVRAHMRSGNGEPPMECGSTIAPRRSAGARAVQHAPAVGIEPHHLSPAPRAVETPRTGSTDRGW